jgi:hypothetical protein
MKYLQDMHYSNKINTENPEVLNAFNQTCSENQRPTKTGTGEPYSQDTDHPAAKLIIYYRT